MNRLFHALLAAALLLTATGATAHHSAAMFDQVSDRNPIVNGRFTSITER